MKKTIAFLLVAVSLQLSAQDGAAYVKGLLESNSVMFDYSVSPKGQSKIKMEGCAIIDGDCYRIIGNELEIICDGTTKWTLDKAAKEAYIEPSEGTRDFLADPSAWIDNVKDLKIGEKTVTGTYIQEDTTFSFKFSSITSLAMSGSTDGFVFDVSGLKDKGWVITDLR